MQYDLEEWRYIPWSNNLYLVSNFGRIKRENGFARNNSLDSDKANYRYIKGKVLKQKTKSNGYKEVNLYIAPQKSKMCYVHRAVYFAFNPNDDFSLEINHKNCDKSDNRLDNLEVVTSSQNMKHAYDNGRLKYLTNKLGEDAPNSKLTNKEVIAIREMYNKTRAVTEISKIFNIGKTQVQRIVKRESWSHI